MIIFLLDTYFLLIKGQSISTPKAHYEWANVHVIN